MAILLSPSSLSSLAVKKKIFHQLQLLRNFHEEFYIVDRHFVELHVTACFNIAKVSTVEL